MSDLQIGLLVVGGLVVAAVLVTNAAQERRARRGAERAFASGHPDVLLDGAALRREPTLESAPRRPPQQEAALPDPRLDYVVELSLQQPASAAAVAERWAPFEHRFAGRAAIAASSDRVVWHPLAVAGNCAGVRAGLQLASRSGPVAESELIEFRAALDTIAAHIGGNVAAPEVRQALEDARQLDQLCADSDIQVVLHVVPRPGGTFGADGPAAAGEAFGVARRGDGGYSLSLDVPRTAEVRRSYDAMVLHARDLCTALDGIIVDDNGQPLDERALAGIGAQLEAVRDALAARGIEPGSPTALRLFA